MTNGLKKGPFAVTKLEPTEQGLYPHTFAVYLVQVESDTEIGRNLHNDPLSVLRDEIPELQVDSEVRAMVLRANAEVPANPVHRSEVWIVIPGSTTAVGIQYKYKERQC